MQTEITPTIRDTTEGKRADAILRRCVHCGFCSATCPTYQLLGDELDSPRGRIYLIKSLLEGKDCGEQTRLHLDRCLTCRACETTCPSGVEYGRLLDIGRHYLEQSGSRRQILDQGKRWLLTMVMPYRTRFKWLFSIGRLFRPVMPTNIRKKIPIIKPCIRTGIGSHARKVILFQGCVQPTLTPGTNAATVRVLDALGIQALTIKGESCCGALSHHLTKTEQARAFMRSNIDHWWPYIEQGIEGIIVTASGCGVMLKDYAELFIDEPAYLVKAKRISEMTYDLAEFLAKEDLQGLAKKLDNKPRRVAFQCPCTLQHGQKLAGIAETVLTRLGYELTEVADSHLCCGSAGTYSLLQPELSRELRNNKIKALKSGEPDLIVTANIGCQLHLQEATDMPVKHWIELLEEV